MNTSVNDMITSIIYTGSLEVELSEQDVTQLNALPMEQVVPLLRAIFEDEREMVAQSRAFSALLAIQGFDHVQFLVNLLDLSQFGWRAAYCRNLSEASDPRAIASLCAILHNDPDSDMRYIAAESLAVIGDLTAVAALEEAQANDTGTDYEGLRVADMARQALERIRERAAP